MLGMLLEVGQVELLQDVQVAALVLAAFPGRWGQVEYGRAFRAQLGALVMGRQEAVAPVAAAGLGRVEILPP